MKWLVLGIIFISFSVFTTSVYAFSFNDVFSWISNSFGRITGYFTNVTEACPYECCFKDPTYQDKECEYPKVCEGYKCVIVETTTTMISSTTTPVIVNEKIKCVFVNANSEQKCFTDDWKFSCAGVGSCVAYVSGVNGAKITWKSSCSGEAYTVIDAYDETIGFKCEVIATTTQPQIPIPAETTTPPLSTCTDSDGGKIYEVKGTAKDTWGEYTDYCSNERQITEYYCQDSGGGRGPVIWSIGAVDCIYGCKDGACLPEPTPVCGDKICQGDSEKASCPQDCSVKCSQGSDCGQSSLYKTCDYAGMPSSAKLPGVSYACTIDTRYNCENPGTFESRCVDVVGASCSPCQSGCQNGNCLSGATSEAPQIGPCNDYDGLNYYLKSYVEYHDNKIYDTCRVINSENDYHDINECSENCYVLEASCSEFGTPRTQAWKCPSNTCKDGACVKVDVKEQIRCLFANVDSPQTCFTDDKKFACSGTGSCTVDVNGEKGATLLWKSTCGDHTSTILDGNNDDAKFNCIPPSNVTENQISGRAFERAYWQCYDGTESTAEDVDGVGCNGGDVWKNAAENFCKNHCKEAEGITKCGVNSFGVSEDCYAEMEKFVVIPSVESIPTQQTTQQSITPKKGILYYFRGDDCPYCLDMDTEIGILKQKGFFNDFEAAGFNIKEEGVSQQYDIKSVPTLILYKDKCSFRKEGFIKSDEIIKWAYEAKCEEEPTLICKDSCPSDGKCYPFGYRKNEKYCSDEGAFKEQLKENEACENNFECSTNVCVDGKCISSGLIQKILNWFRKLFGAD